MIKRSLIGAGLVLFTVAGGFVLTNAQSVFNNRKAVRVFDGYVTQINALDGTFSLRLRDGSVVLVKSPIISNTFVSIKGSLQEGTLDGVTSLTLKDPNGSDAIPSISLLTPGSGQVGTKIVLNGSGFLKKNNSINIGKTPNAVIGLPSRDGKTLTFQLPSSACNQKAAGPAACPQKVFDPGNYDLAVSNENGVSNPVPFTILPLPPLTITTDILPQVPSGMKYAATISAIGGAETYVWRITDGKLPPGLMLAQAACSERPCRTAAVISGTPPIPGTYQFTVTLTSGQETISRQFSLIVVPAVSTPYGY